MYVEIYTSKNYKIPGYNKIRSPLKKYIAFEALKDKLPIVCALPCSILRRQKEKEICTYRTKENTRCNDKQNR